MNLPVNTRFIGTPLPSTGGDLNGICAATGIFTALGQGRSLSGNSAGCERQIADI
jgi:hypothetical protein